MKAVCSFVEKFASLIVCVLSCFDRVIFKGYLPLSRVSELEKFVDFILKIRRVDFLKKHAPQYAQRLVDHAKRLAEQSGRPFEYRQGKFRKEQWATRHLREQRVTAGLIGVLCTKETCPTFQLIPGKDRPHFVPAQIPQRVLYFYFLDPNLGLIHVRLQTWLPFTIQVYVNGHDYVAQQLLKKKLQFVQEENAFTQLENPSTTQKLADRFAKLPWPKILNRYALLVNPLLHDVLKGSTYYWVTDQAEYATDILFTSKNALAGLFTKLLEYAWLTFSAKDILVFLGRKLHPRFDGEVLTDCKTERQTGARIKHRVKNNWLKMYDKFALILRIETVINQPGEFKIYRECTRKDGTRYWAWRPMPKGVGNLHHYQHHASASNHRYLQALALVNDPTPAQQQLVKLTEPQKVKQRGYAGFNPARQDDLRLFAAVLDGNHIGQGFRNQDIRQVLYKPAVDRKQRYRQSAAIGRLLKRLHLRHFLDKIPRTRRWKVTDQGRRVLGDALAVYRRYWPECCSRLPA
jgi:hypothetical protein